MLRSLFRAVAYRLSYQLLFFVVGLFLAAIAGPQIFGIIALMTVNAAAFIIITDFGTGAALVWHGAGNEVRREGIFSFAVGSGVVQLFLFLFVELIVVKISGRTLLTRQPYSSLFLLSDLLYFTGLIITEKYTALFYARNKASLVNKALVIMTACFLVVFILAYFNTITNINPVFFFASMTFSLGFGTAIVFHVGLDKMKFSKPGNQDLRSLLGFSAIVFVTNIIQFFAYRLDFWLVDHFYSHTALGVYAQANRFVQLAWVLPTIVASLLAPAMRDPGNPMGDQVFLTLSRLLNLATIVIVLGIVAIAFFMYSWFLPPGYSRGLPPLLIMLPGYFFFATTTLLAAWFSAKRLLKVNLVGSCLCFLLILVADLTLIPAYSLVGAALANTLAYSMTTLYFVLQFQRYASARWKDLFLWNKKDISLLKIIFPR